MNNFIHNKYKVNGIKLNTAELCHVKIHEKYMKNTIGLIAQLDRA